MSTRYEDGLWAWMTMEPDGKLSLIGAMIEDMHLPLIAGDEDSIRKFLPLAWRHKKRTGQPVWLRKWTTYKDEPEL